MIRRSLRHAVVALALTAGVVAIPASAAPTWLAVTPVTDGTTSPFNPIVVSDPSGNLTAVWSRFVGSQRYVVESAYRSVGGAWTAPVQVSSAGDAGDAATASQLPDVAVDASGTATAVWSVGASPGPFVVKSSSRPAGGSWSVPVTLSADSSFFPIPSVTVGPAGDATALWRRFVSGNQLLETSTRPAGTFAWGPPEILDTDTGPHDLTAGPDGTVVAVWPGHDGSAVVTRTRIRAPGGPWGPPVTLSPAGTGDTGAPAVAASATGSFTVVWERLSSPSVYFVQSKTRLPDGTWTASTDVSVPSITSPSPSVAMDPAGNATAVWARFDGVKYYLRGAQRPAEGTWSPSIDVTDALQGVGRASVAMDDHGRVRVAWSQNLGGPDSHWRVTTADKSPTGSWSLPLSLSDPGTDSLVVSLALDPAGDGAAVWYRNVSSGSIIEAAGMDAGGPVVSSFSASPAGKPGAALPYSASATDAWSAVAGYSWSFGDGATASGPDVVHSYAAAGSYPVTLTVTDAVGNTTTRSATTTITALPVPTPAVTTFKLTKKKVEAGKKTKLKVGLNTAATVKIVIKSKHKHLVKGKRKFVRVVLTKQLPAGLSKITIKTKVKGKKLKPDTYVLTGRASNSVGKSPKAKTKLKVVR